ncbi:thioredoxin domain-containing protein [Bifidobacterium sp. ESL0790]|uniref:thioredoxin domain-containing protein n=1 Tax=Bifidobacterium sp. ESL0790 TaxID=2983233 RepID=UPI0023F63952|nr:thioredoxin domain-containing protein [Bifidobacterium sp. ESL0790]WEV71936.1 thioredoxin domain-containing protein [Bifidobacterium sp. ESL0790]
MTLSSDDTDESSESEPETIEMRASAPSSPSGTTATGTIQPRKSHQRLIIGAITTVIVVALIAVIGVTAWRNHQKAQDANSPQALSEAYTALQNVSQKPAGATKQGGLPAYNKAKRNPQAPTVEIYEDFLCPYCAKLARQLEPTLIRLQDAGQINLEFHVVNFLDTPSTNRYSTRTASAVAYVSAHDPEHVAPFVSALFEKGFQPDENKYKDVSDEQIAKQAVKAGVDPQVAEAAVKGTYADYITKVTEYTAKRTELYTTIQGTHSFFTPTIRVNGHIWPVNVFGNLDKTPEQFCGSIGIERADVGNPNVMPKVGATGEPGAIKK